jgi:acylphosphatase
VHETNGAKRFYISGSVQGVGFRYFARQAAQRLGVTGYAKNLSDGRVEVYAIGDASALSLFRAELERGPRGAMVSEVAEEAATLDPKFERAFLIEHDNW